MNADEDKRDLRNRTKYFALRIIRLYVALPKTTEAQVIGEQVLRSGTSVEAHYREANLQSYFFSLLSSADCV